jgi:Flp pilus assembly protein TadG
MKTKMIIKDQKGGALIEFAIVLPLLILLVIGAIEFGLLCYNKQVIANASREGARAGIIAFGRDYYLDDPEIITIVKNYCATHVITFSASPDLDTDLNVTLDPATPNREDTTSFEFGDPFEVSVSYNYDFLIPSLFGSSDQNGQYEIKAATMMKREASI